MSEKQYEIVMYKLLTIVLAGIFIAIGVGFVLGTVVGEANADIETPEYCYSQYSEGKIIIKCNELSDTTIAELCTLLSSEIEEKTKVVLIN